MSQLKAAESTVEFNEQHDRLARALRLVSKIKGIELKKINDKETLPENNKAVLKHFSDLSKSNKKPSVLSPPLQKVMNQPDKVDDLAEELQSKVQYAQLN